MRIVSCNLFADCGHVFDDVFVRLVADRTRAKAAPAKKPAAAVAAKPAAATPAPAHGHHRDHRRQADLHPVP